jgi:hypothetical protein
MSAWEFLCRSKDALIHVSMERYKIKMTAPVYYHLPLIYHRNVYFQRESTHLLGLLVLAAPNL